MIPREPLLPQLAIDGSPGGLVLAAGAPLTQILTNHLGAVWQVLPQLRPGETAAVADGLMAAIAHAFWPMLHASETDLEPPAQTTLVAVTELIEARLDRPDLGPAYLCRALGCSRSQLYRLFEPLGGIAGYIRDQRMLRAWRLLTAVASRKARIIDIAHRCGFTDQAHFSRLFRRHFGMAPRDARHLSIDAAAQVSSSADPPAYAHWLSGLTTEPGGSAATQDRPF